MDGLQRYGWNDYFAAQFKKAALTGCVPARVVADFGTAQKIVMPEERSAVLSNQLLHGAHPSLLPKVGDWVLVRIADAHTATIEAVLPRESELARRAAGTKAVKQVMAANVDIAFVLQGLDNDFSPERLQRYLYQLSASHIRPVIVLNKADKVTNPESYQAQLTSLGVPIIVSSVMNGAGVDQIMDLILPGRTAVLVGSSGAGKSTLTNRLLGSDTQKIQSVRRRDDTGRHTTTHRELFLLPNGGLLMDTPGIRELQLWGVEDDLKENFDDVLALAAQCQYHNCSHTTETGCAVQAALAGGKLDAAHYANYLKMRHELQVLALQKSQQAAARNKKRIRPASRHANKRLSSEDLQELES